MRLSAHLGTLFGELAPLERPAAARAAGFAEIEAWWPPAPDPRSWIAAVRAAGVRAVLVNADGGDLAAGERGFCNVPGREDEVLRAVREAASVVTACGGETVNLLVGRVDPQRPRDEQLALAREVVRAAAGEARRAGARIVIEHLNGRDVEGPLLGTPTEAATFVRSVDHDGVRVLFDAYHAHRAGLDPLEEVGRVADVLGHVQYADSPGRGAPGTGEIDLARFAERAEAAGYAGPIGLEFVPAGPTAPALAAIVSAA